MIEEVEKMYTNHHDELRLQCEKQNHHGIRSGYYIDDDVSQDEAVRAMRKKVSEAVELSKTDRVLDIGCGFGGCLVWLAEEFNTSGIGIDIVEPQLDVARNLAKEHGVSDKVDFRRDDFHEMASIDADSFDIVWASEALMHTTKDNDVVERMSEVLTNNGQAVIAGIFVDKYLRSKKEQNLLRSFHRGRNAYLSHIDDIVDTLKSNGFQSVKRQEITENVVPDLQRGYRFIRWIYLPYVRLFHLFGQKDKNEVEAVSALVAANRLVELDVLGYFIISAKLNR